MKIVLFCGVVLNFILFPVFNIVAYFITTRNSHSANAEVPSKEQFLF